MKNFKENIISHKLKINDLFEISINNVQLLINYTRKENEDSLIQIIQNNKNAEVLQKNLIQKIFWLIYTGHNYITYLRVTMAYFLIVRELKEINQTVQNIFIFIQKSKYTRYFKYVNALLCEIQKYLKLVQELFKTEDAIINKEVLLAKETIDQIYSNNLKIIVKRISNLIGSSWEEKAEILTEKYNLNFENLKNVENLNYLKLSKSYTNVIVALNNSKKISDNVNGIFNELNFIKTNKLS